MTTLPGSTHAVVYGPQRVVLELPDDCASSVRLVVVTKLRRNESFLLSGLVDGRREEIWVHSSIELTFTGPFTQPVVPALTQILMNDANRGTLHIPPSSVSSSASAMKVPQAA